jgi:hypothetical protein
MWEDLIVHAMLGVLQMVIKNPVKKEQLCHVLIEIRDTITGIYPAGCPK